MHLRPIFGALVSLALKSSVLAWTVVPGQYHHHQQQQQQQQQLANPRTTWLSPRASRSIHVSLHGKDGEDDESEPHEHALKILVQVGRKWIATAAFIVAAGLSPAYVTHSATSSPHPFWAPAPALALTESILTDEGSQLAVSGSVFNEVWSLVDKYYIDRTFGGQVSGERDKLQWFMSFAFQSLTTSTACINTFYHTGLEQGIRQVRCKGCQRFGR